MGVPRARTGIAEGRHRGPGAHPGTAREYQFNSTSPSFFETQGANRLLAVLVLHRSIGTITGMTLDGTAMTPIFTATGTGTGSARRAVAGYYMIAPPVGVKTLGIHLFEQRPLTIRCFGVVDAHQTTPFRDQGSGALPRLALVLRAQAPR